MKVNNFLFLCFLGHIDWLTCIANSKFCLVGTHMCSDHTFCVRFFCISLKEIL